MISHEKYVNLLTIFKNMSNSHFMSKNIRRLILGAFIFATTICASSHQAFKAEPADTALNNIVKFFQHTILFNKVMPQEKVYLHFDNTGYFKGETMHFKAYAIRTDTGAPSDISKVLYVELLNPSGDVVATHKLKMENGAGKGDLELDSIFGTGFYEVRAYTRYMINWGGTCAFSRVFPIYKKPAKEGDYSKPLIDELTYVHRLPNGRELLASGEAIAQSKTKRSAKGYTVKFYPEGGELVQGIENRVAFTVDDDEGRHAAVMGILSDSNGNTVTTVSTDESGRGVFQLIPERGGYSLTLTTEEGKRLDFLLPQAKFEGCNLKVDAINDPLTVTVNASPAFSDKVLGYTLINRGVVVSYDTLTVYGSLELEFDRANLSPGVNQFTLFDGSGKILAERLFFINPTRNEQDSIHIKCATTDLTPCCKIRVELDALPNSNLSFAAMDAATMTDGRVGNAQTWMILSSDIKGYIENPDYYFESDDLEHRKAADLLMMVQGWRRYDWRLYSGATLWKDMENYNGKLQPIEDQLYVHGKLLPTQSKWKKKHPVAGVNLQVVVYNEKGEHCSGETVTDSLGNYAFKLPDMEGEWNMQMLTKFNDKAANYIVSVDRHFAPEARYLSPYETEPIPLPEAFKKAKEEAEIIGNTPGLAKKDGQYVIPTVKVKKRYFTDDSWLPWYDEGAAARHSIIYYNVDEATDKTIDMGETLPTLYQWLKSKNEFFSGDDDLVDLYIPTRIEPGEIDTAGVAGKLVKVEGDVIDNYMNAVYKGGLMYKNKPVVWIVNNQYVCTSYYNRSTFNVIWNDNQSGAAAMPTFIDEVKSVYVSEEGEPYKKYIIAEEFDAIHPITVFVYTHPQFFSKVKGIRRTHFQGYNKPETFKMEDYSVMPPMEDFRRTIFWEPDVKTNYDGKAYIDFFNNSSCKTLYFSAEGFTGDGKILVSE